ncbi:MAG: nucleotidyltransferase family protein [Desulfobacterales bacterium]|nr:nucleotidyltransferase family protein [Desulfobacterales bacterium]
MKNVSSVTEKLFLNLIHPDTEKLEIQALLSDEIDWKDFQEKTYAHRIAPLVYSNLKQLDLLNFVPKPVIRALEMSLVYTSRANIMMGEELKKILCVFNERGISCIVLKGHAFIETIYHKNPAVRPLRDIDLLLKKNEVKEAGLVLKQMGYQFYNRSMGEHLYRESHFHLPFQKRVKDNCFHVELHWHLIAPDIPVNLNMDDFRQRAVEIDFFGTKADVLHPEDALIYLIWHSSLNGFNELLSLADFLYLIKYHNPSWGKMISRIRDSQLDIPLYWMSYITYRLSNFNLMSTLDIDPISKIFTKIFFNNKNILEQFINFDWTLHPLLLIFMFKNKRYGTKRIFKNLPPFPRNLKVIGHYIYSFFWIWYRYVQEKRQRIWRR